MTAFSARGGLPALAIAFVVGAVSACGTGQASPGPSQNAAPDAQTGAGTVLYQLPFATGTMASIGSYAIHAGNFNSVDASPNPVIEFAGAGTTKASLDFLVGAGTAVHPVASGSVISAWGLCDVAVVDHGNGVWSEYVHIAVSAKVGDHVTPDSTLGTVLAQQPAGWSPPATCGNLENGPPHLHLSFASGSGSSGTYIPMAGTVLCGHAVDAAGNLTGLGTVGGPAFVVPTCPSSGTGVPPLDLTAWHWQAGPTFADGAFNDGEPAFLLTDGRVLVSDSVTETTSAFTAVATAGESSAHVFEQDPSMNTDMSVPLGDDRALVLGSVSSPNGGSDLPMIETLDLTTGKSSPLKGYLGNMPPMAATPLADGRVLVLGADTQASVVSQTTVSTQVYDSASNSWRRTAPMKTPCWPGLSFLLPNGLVFVLGDTTPYGNTATAVAQIYDPAADAWRSAGPLPPALQHARDFPEGDAGVVLSDGRVLLVGASTEIFDPRTSTWTTTVAPAQTHYGGTAALLANGMVLVTGGSANLAATAKTAASAEVFDPKTGSWHNVAAPLTQRLSALSVTLPDGRVMVIGGLGQKPVQSPCPDCIQAGGLPRLTTSEIFGP